MNTVLINAQNIGLQQHAPPDQAAVDIVIHTGATLGFIGPDKTLISSWLQTLAAITAPANGQLQFLGKDTHRLDRNNWQRLRTELAYLNHESTLLSVLSTQENILLPALYHQLDTREALQKHMYTLLDSIGFTDLDSLAKLPAYIDELAYAQAMFVRLALTKPRLVILDNNLRHFDERTSRKLLRFLQTTLSASQTSLILQDDDLNFVLKQATRIIFVDRNCLLQFDTPDDFRASSNQNVLQYMNDLATS